ncbi:MAG: hypothetical protein ACQGVC_26455 [Myxococcota bacterium]
MGCRRGTVSRQCRLRLRSALAAAVGLVGAGCAAWPPSWPAWPPPPSPHVVTAPAPSQAERYCAWYGDADGRTLYVGLSPFWSAMRAAGDDPRADLEAPGPQWIGRFDLRREQWLDPLDVGTPDSRAGVWDVLATDAEGVYFTPVCEAGGRVDPESGAVTRFEAAGLGLNELAPGPGGRVLVSRYGGGGASKAHGELLALSPDGAIAERWPMGAPLGFFAAPKTPAWNPVHRRLVATSDVLPEFDGDPRHDAYTLALDEDEADWERSPSPELQFVAVTPDGVEYRVEARDDGGLWLRRVRPPGREPEDQSVLLDPAFPAALDFAQDLKRADDGRLVVTRWSGVVHVVEPRRGTVETLRLPRLERGGLYYTGVIHRRRLCASHCGGVTVVCTDAP